MQQAPTASTPLVRRLLDEHIEICNALTVLKVLNARLERRRPVNVGDLRILVEFFKQYADGVHHHTEEEILFTAVAHNRVMSSMSQRLLTQHTMGRIFLGEMTEAIAAAQAGCHWRKRFIDSASAYHTLLIIHICDEDHVFFPQAERILRHRRIRMAKESNDIRINHLLKRVRRLFCRWVPSGTCGVHCK